MLSHLFRTSPTERIYRGEYVDFLVLNREDAGWFAPAEPYMVISITDPGREPAEIAESPSRKALLRLCFDDVAGVTNPLLKPFAAPYDVPLSPEIAAHLLTFIQANLSTARLVICHCEMGVSRSAGVAAALSHILNNEDGYFFTNYLPNRWVYNLLLERNTALNVLSGPPQGSPLPCATGFPGAPALSIRPDA